ncbi:hypothetical protein [Clostridium sp. Cult2]|nr:hypothetical protein [Clostridium sp. Cult2]
MAKKKNSVFSKILKPKKSSCCSMEIIEEPCKEKDEGETKKEKD